LSETKRKEWLQGTIGIAFEMKKNKKRLPVPIILSLQERKALRSLLHTISFGSQKPFYASPIAELLL
jgi:hypothetical protein